ncbi:hypothetical protein [Azospirillum argentinense]
MLIPGQVVESDSLFRCYSDPVITKAEARALDRKNRSRIAEDRISDAGIALCEPTAG